MTNTRNEIKNSQKILGENLKGDLDVDGKNI
jgi:hypothetical protein